MDDVCCVLLHTASSVMLQSILQVRSKWCWQDRLCGIYEIPNWYEILNLSIRHVYM